jgi:hypothetical protein
MTETGIDMMAAMIAGKPLKVTVKRMDMSTEAIKRRERAAKLRASIKSLR